MRRVSGPLLDRIDLRVVMPRVDPERLVWGTAPESSAVVAARVRDAWEQAQRRNEGRANAMLHGQGLLRACALDVKARATLTDLSAGLELTARGVHRLLRVARTIADLRGREVVGSEEIYAAASLRDRSLEAGLTA
jgi:magnesium chelatase family protein